MSQIDTLHITTSNIAAPAVVTVVVPKAYLQEGDTTRYPTVYLLNGYDGDHTSYVKSTPLDSLADSNNIILVCPDGRDSWYFDSPVDPSMQMESYITCDVISTIDRRLRTRADRNNRAIAGLSMGGHGALWIAMRHPDMFASAGSMSGAVDINMPRFHNRWKIKQWLGSYESVPQVWKTHTVMSLLPQLSPGRLRLIVACGDKDIFIGVNNNLHKSLTSRGIDHVYSVTPGNHSWVYWRQTLPLLLDFFNQTFTYSE